MRADKTLPDGSFVTGRIDIVYGIDPDGRPVWDFVADDGHGGHLDTDTAVAMLERTRFHIQLEETRQEHQ